MMVLDFSHWIYTGCYDRTTLLLSHCIPQQCPPPSWGTVSNPEVKRVCLVGCFLSRNVHCLSTFLLNLAICFHFNMVVIFFATTSVELRSVRAISIIASFYPTLTSLHDVTVFIVEDMYIMASKSFSWMSPTLLCFCLLLQQNDSLRRKTKIFNKSTTL